MRVVVAPDKLRGTLSAAEAAAALAAGWRRADPRADVEEVPVADGGEGTLDALVAALGGEVRWTRVGGPLGDPVEAPFGVADGPAGPVAVVEMARASGLTMVAEDRRDPLRASTRGTGELVLAAVDAGARRVVVCLGGSATNDAGAGAAAAVGVRLLDADARELPPGGAALLRLHRIDVAGLDRRVSAAEIVAATDVDNPLTGPHGAANVFGPQKGCTPQQVALLDRAHRHFAAVVRRDLGVDLADVPGAGAAGGLAAGLVALAGARIRSGFEVVAEAVGLPSRLERADVAITAEGRYDRQSARGKAPAGVLAMAREAGCRTVLVAGQIEEGIPAPADVMWSLTDRWGLEAAMSRPRELLEEAAAAAAGELS
jgi:glycerate kinase